MPEMPAALPVPAPRGRRPADAPLATDDGRPFRQWSKEGTPADLALWVPLPCRDGDPVYCCGVRVGVAHGDLDSPPGGYITTVEASAMPAALAAHVRERRAANPPAPPL